MKSFKSIVRPGLLGFLLLSGSSLRAQSVDSNTVQEVVTLQQAEVLILQYYKPGEEVEPGSDQEAQINKLRDAKLAELQTYAESTKAEAEDKTLLLSDVVKILREKQPATAGENSLKDVLGSGEIPHGGSVREGELGENPGLPAGFGKSKGFAPHLGGDTEGRGGNDGGSLGQGRVIQIGGSGSVEVGNNPGVLGMGKVTTVGGGKTGGERGGNAGGTLPSAGTVGPDTGSGSGNEGRDGASRGGPIQDKQDWFKGGDEQEQGHHHHHRPPRETPTPPDKTPPTPPGSDPIPPQDWSIFNPPPKVPGPRPGEGGPGLPPPNPGPNPGK